MPGLRPVCLVVGALHLPYSGSAYYRLALAIICMQLAVVPATKMSWQCRQRKQSAQDRCSNLSLSSRVFNIVCSCFGSLSRIYTSSLLVLQGAIKQLLKALYHLTKKSVPNGSRFKLWCDWLDETSGHVMRSALLSRSPLIAWGGHKTAWARLFDSLTFPRECTFTRVKDMQLADANSFQATIQTDEETKLKLLYNKFAASCDPNRYTLLVWMFPC